MKDIGNSSLKEDEKKESNGNEIENEIDNEEEEFDTECEEAHLLWEVMISCFKIADSVNTKACDNSNDIYSFDFFLRDDFRKKDLIILIGIAGANFNKFIEKALYHKLEDKILLTVIKK